MPRVASSCVRLAVALALLASLAVSLLAVPLQVSAQTDEDTGVDGNSYVSPAFGYSFEWDRTWEVADELVEADYNLLRLSDGSSILWIIGAAPAVDNLECVENDIASLETQDGISTVEATDPAVTEDGGVESDLSFSLTSEDEETGEESTSDWLGYVKCLEINDGEANLLVSHYGVDAAWDDSAAGREDILATLETDGAAGPGDDEEPAEDEADEPVDTSETDSLLTEVQGDGDAPANVDEILVLFEASINDIVLYWERQYPLISSGEEFVPPTFVPWVGELDTACGTITGWDPEIGSGDGPLQCGADLSVYLDINFVEFQYEQVGPVPFLVTSVIAHEVGHHVQDVIGMEACYETPCLDPNQLTGLEIEYMADCFAGAWAADAQLRGRLGARDVDLAIVQWATTLGGGTESADWGSHGTGAERAWWFLNGYVEGANVCFETSEVTRAWMTSGDEPAPDATEEPADPDPTEETPASGGSGDTFALGDAIDTSQGEIVATETRVFALIDTREADGQFVTVYIEFDPADDGPYHYSGWTVVDGDGSVYELDERATDLLLSSAYPDGTDQAFDAGAGQGIAFVFDLPVDASDLVLVNEDEGIAIQLDI